MKNLFDFTIVGAGLFGAVFAREIAEQGKTALVVDQRDHIGGNCYTEKIEGIDVHKYGPHIFHTNNKGVWNYVNRFSKFNNYQHRIKVNYDDRMYSFPINLMTLYQIWGIKNPQEAIRKLEEVRVPIKNPRNLEEWIISQVGTELYEIFVKGYTEKQWGKDPSELPSSIIRRIPIRTTYNDCYFDDEFQGIPSNGYTRMFENILDHKNIKIELGVNFFDSKKKLTNVSNKLVYTGKIDEFFNYKYGELEYRSLVFKTNILNGDFQGSSIVNYTHKDVPFTRIIEHKHFAKLNSPVTVVTREYPDKYEIGKTPYYPVRDEKNLKIYNKYELKGKKTKVIFGGRLGTYQYYDMHQIVAQAITMASKHKNE